MRYVLFACLILSFVSCETDNFNADKRQIMAKDFVRSKIGRNTRGFDIVSFREDTLSNFPDSNFKKPLQYTIDYIFNDSTGMLQRKRGLIVFAPDGKSIIKTQITDR
jgi:hypothetical protein